MSEFDMTIVDGVLKSFSGGGEVVVPEGVTEIGESVFAANSDVTSVILPSTLKKIGKQAFYACAALRTAEVPQGTVEIGDGAFANCTALSSVHIPESVKVMGGWVFRGCDAQIFCAVCSRPDGWDVNWNRRSRGSDSPSEVKTDDEFLRTEWGARNLN